MLQGRGAYGLTITAIELRFIQRHYHNFVVKPKFYRNDVEVDPPWIASAMSATLLILSSDDSIDAVATRFKKRLFTAASKGKPLQRDAFVVWLAVSGRGSLLHFCETLGLAPSNFASVLGCLTKSMIASHGPKPWYTMSRLLDGDCRYEIVPGIIPPLRRAFESDC